MKKTNYKYKQITPSIPQVQHADSLTPTTSKTKSTPRVSPTTYLVTNTGDDKSFNYKEYLKSPEWKERSADAKKRAGYRCQVCNRSREDGIVLESHHRTYERVGHEDPSDITVLCDICHGLFSGEKLDAENNRPSDTRIIPRSRMKLPQYLVTMVSDEKLAQSAQKGDKLAFNTLIVRHRDDAYKFAYKIIFKPNGRLSAAQCADDVLQEACLNAWKYIKSCKPKHFRNWFRAIIRNECYKLFGELKKDSKYVDIYADIDEIVDVGNQMMGIPEFNYFLSQTELDSHEKIADRYNSYPRYTSAVDIIGDEILSEYRDAINALPPRQRQILSMVVDGYTNKEIAKELDTTVNNVRVNLHKSRKKLRKSLKNA